MIDFLVFVAFCIGLIYLSIINPQFRLVVGVFVGAVVGIVGLVLLTVAHP
ncbi:MAG TPA: hypothetical protein VGJ20_15280 [Xanthobacteraceae bacterium]|jgi:hypothetical protein